MENSEQEYEVKCYKNDERHGVINVLARNYCIFLDGWKSTSVEEYYIIRLRTLGKECFSESGKVVDWVCKNRLYSGSFEYEIRRVGEYCTAKPQRFGRFCFTKRGQNANCI